VDPLAAAVVFVRSQVCPAVELPAPVTDPVADAFVEATDPDAVTAFTANAPATRTARTAIKATATVVFTRVHLLRFFSGGPRRPEAILVFHDPTRISHQWRPNPDRGVTKYPSATGFQKVFDGFRSSTCMVVMRRISGAGRGLLVLGAALLLVSLFGSLVLPSTFPSTYVTWFTLSGNQPQLPAGSYTGIQVTELMNTLVSGPYLWIAFGSLLVSAAAAIAIGGIGERTRHFGTFGVLILLLYAGLLYVAAYQFNQQAPGGDAAISIGYGFLTAMAACVLIEAGARLPSSVSVRARVPTVSSGRRA